MRSAGFFIVACLALLALTVAAPGPAAPLVPSAVPVEAPPAATTAAAVTIAPHRAIYDMALSSVKNGGNVSSVSGRMLFEWADVCDGWAVQQHLKLHFNYAEGDQSDVTSTEVTWEAKDGSAYNFNIRRVTDGKETENYKGKATIGPDGGSAVYTLPADKTQKLPAGTLFPSSHTRMILQQAMAGEKLFSRRVFDGSDEDGSNDVSVFIDPPQAHWLDAVADLKLKHSKILDQTSWPVRMAFYKLDTTTGEPDYEMDLNLLANGVARSMRIDYGDFSVTGTLSAIEPLPAPHC